MFNQTELSRLFPSTALINDMKKKEKFIIEEGILKSCNSDRHNIIIPGTVIEIGESAVSCNDNIESVVISPGTKKIGFGAFSWCKNLKTVTIPDSVEEIDQSAFCGCSSLANVQISKTSSNLHEIRYLAFSGCGSLKEITIPDSVEDIWPESFSMCDLKKIYGGKNVKSIGKHAFFNCTKTSDKSRLSLKDSNEDIVAYKWFNKGMCSLDSTLDIKPGPWKTYTLYKSKDECSGFSAYISPLDIFNDINAFSIGKDIFIRKVVCKSVDFTRPFDSEFTCKEIMVLEKVSVEDLFKEHSK